jgi:hypothetical protein
MPKNAVAGYGAPDFRINPQFPGGANVSLLLGAERGMLNDEYR